PQVWKRLSRIRAGSVSDMVLAVREVEFTTEGKQIDRGSGFVEGACEGTSNLHCESRVLRFQREIALHRPIRRARQHINRGGGRRQSFNIAGVARKVVNARFAEITVVLDLAA